VPPGREASQDDLDRILPLLRLAAGDVGEDAAPCRLDHEFRIRRMQERDNRAGRFVDDLLDQLERMLRALAETDERDIRLLARGYRSDLADLDLRSDHLVPEAGDKGCDVGEAILALVGDEHPETSQVTGVSGRIQRGAKNRHRVWRLAAANRRETRARAPCARTCA
jgi:hypothetical protein